jgi:hypothetical protein
MKTSIHSQALIITMIILFPIYLLAQPAVYINDRGNNAVNKYDFDGNFIEVFIPSGLGGLSNPQDIIFHPDGTVLVSSFQSSEILQYDADGNFLGVWNQAPVTSPSKMIISSDNLLYITQWGTTTATSKVARFNLDGTAASDCDNSAPRGLGVFFDASNNFYVALWSPTGDGVVQQYDSGCGYITDIIDSVELDAPTYIWQDPGGTGDILVEDWTLGKILRYDSNGTYLGDDITGLSNPEGYAYLPNGNLLVSERGISEITEYDTNNNVVGQWNQGPALDTPNSIVIGEPLLSVAEFDLNPIFVTPTIGTVFRFNTSFDFNYNSFMIYNSSGMLVEYMFKNGSAHWDASNLPEGLYFIAAIFNGKQYTQKIIVKKN